MREIVVRPRTVRAAGARGSPARRAAYLVVLIVFELDEGAPQRAMNAAHFGDALALGILLRGNDVQGNEDEAERTRDQNRNQPQGEKRSGADFHGATLLTMSFTCWPSVSASNGLVT